VKSLGCDRYPHAREEEMSMKRAVVVELSALRERVERWRERREGTRARIPEELWNAAVGVARVEGVYATCRALRFNYYSLKDRVNLAESKEGAERGEKIEGAAFVELGAAELGGGGKTVVELVGRNGGRMRIDMSGAIRVDMVGLVQAFWSHEA
jgi:hypothetical protein